MLSRPAILSLIALMLPAGGLAQTVGEASAPAAPAGKKSIVTVQAELAPEWATQNPLALEDVSDATTVSLAIKAAPKITDRLSLDLSFGPTARLDSDEDDKDGASSSIGGSAELAFALDEAKRATLFGSVVRKHNFTDFFDNDKDKEWNYSAGAQYFKPLLYIGEDPSTTLKARAFYTWSNSSDDQKDYEAAQLRLNWANPIKWWGLFDVEGTFARRWYQDVNLEAGKKEKRDQGGLSAGIDLAPLFRRLTGDDPSNPFIRKMRGGAGYFRSNSNIDANDDDGTVKPVASIALGRDF